MVFPLAAQTGRRADIEEAGVTIISEKYLIGQTPPDQWDNWLIAQGYRAGFCQSNTWAHLNAMVNGAAPWWVTVYDGDALIAGAMLCHTRPKSMKFTLRAAFRNQVTGANKGHLACYGGPVLSDTATGSTVKILLDGVDEIVRSIRPAQVDIILPAFPTSDTPISQMASALEDRSFKVRPWLTSLVDLSVPESAILGSFKHAARKGIRKCQDGGLTVSECVSFEDYVKDFLIPYGLSVGKDLADLPMSALKARWEIGASTHYRYFAAKHPDGSVVGTLGTVRFNGIACELMSGRPPKADPSLPAQDLLHWHVFLAHKALGDQFFDLAGFSPAPTSSKEEGIRRFKEKWSGQLMEIPTYSREFPSAAVRIARKLRSLRHQSAR